MYRFLFPAVAAALTLALTTGSAHARSHSDSTSHNYSHNHSHNYSHNFSTYQAGSNHHFTPTNSYASKYGTKFSHGYYFHARNFYWNSRSWSSRYGCYCYWCPYVNSWYYWCAPQNCYYPVSYITVVPPTVTPAPLAVNGPVSGGPDSAMEPAVPPVP